MDDAWSCLYVMSYLVTHIWLVVFSLLNGGNNYEGTYTNVSLKLHVCKSTLPAKNKHTDNWLVLHTARSAREWRIHLFRAPTFYQRFSYFR